MGGCGSRGRRGAAAADDESDPDDGWEQYAERERAEASGEERYRPGGAGDAAAQLLELLLGALAVLRDNPALSAGTRERCAVDDLVRATSASLLEGYEETIALQQRRIETLERRRALAASVANPAPFGPHAGARGAPHRTSDPAMMRADTVGTGDLAAPLCFSRVCPLCASARQLRHCAAQTDAAGAAASPGSTPLQPFSRPAGPPPAMPPAAAAAGSQRHITGVGSLNHHGSLRSVGSSVASDLPSGTRFAHQQSAMGRADSPRRQSLRSEPQSHHRGQGIQSRASSIAAGATSGFGVGASLAASERRDADAEAEHEVLRALSGRARMRSTVGSPRDSELAAADQHGSPGAPPIGAPSAIRRASRAPRHNKPPPPNGAADSGDQLPLSPVGSDEGAGGHRPRGAPPAISASTRTLGTGGGGGQTSTSEPISPGAASPGASPTALRLKGGGADSPGRRRPSFALWKVAGEAAKNTTIYRELARNRNTAEVLLRVSLGLGACSFDSDALLPKLLSEARALFAASSASFWQVDELTGAITDPGLHLSSDDQADAQHEDDEHTLSGMIARGIVAEGEVVLLNDCSVHPQYSAESSRTYAGGLQNLLAVPVKFESTTVAVACVVNTSAEGGFVPDDERLFEGFAALAGVSLRNSRLFRKAVFQQKKAAAMLKIARTLAVSDLEGTNLPSLIMRSARSLGNADRCALFVVDDERGEFNAHFHSRNGEDETLVMPMDSDIAGHVARTGQAINLIDAYEDPRFNRDIDELTGYRTRSLLCLPVMYENNIVAVAQLINKIGAAAFGDDEMELFETFAAFAGVSLRNSWHYQEMMRQRKTTDTIIHIVRGLAESDIRNIDNVTSKVMDGAKELCAADRCALFLVDEEHHQLVAKVAASPAAPAPARSWALRRDSDESDDGASPDESPTSPSTQETQEIRIPIGAGIAGSVAQAGQLVNIADAYQDSRFNPEVDRRTGYRTRSILAYPIKNEGRVVAVAQLINKKDVHGRDDVFTSEDERLLQSFAAFAGITIGNARLYRFVVDAGNRAMDLFNLQGGHAPASKEGRKKQVRVASTEAAARLRLVEVSRQEIELVQTVGFPIHDYFAPSTSHEHLVPLTAWIFRDAGLVDRFRIDEAMLFRFIATVKGMYRSVPYHNFAHAFDVMQTLYLFLTMGRVRGMLEDLDVLALLMIGLFHDLDHMGLNNSFHLKAETPLGMLSSASGSRSVLEVHHCSLAIEILMNDDTNILCTLTDDEKKAVFKIMINAILATDMSRHMEIVGDFKKGLSQPYDKKSEEHRMRLMQILVKSADVSNVCKPFKISRHWGRKVQQEFDSQGEQEKKKDMTTVSSAVDFDVRHNLLAFGRGQLWFMGNMVLPMVKLLCQQAPGIAPFREQLQKNHARWRRAIDEATLAYSLACDTSKGMRYRYYYKLAAFAVQRAAMEGRELDVVAHLVEQDDAAAA